MRDAAFAFIWMVLLPASFLSAHVGVLLWIWIALLSPHELLYGVLAGVPFNKIVAITTLILVVVSNEKKHPYFDTTMALLLTLAFVGTVSWITEIVSTPVSTELYLKLIKEIVLALTIMVVMASRNRLHLAALVIVAAVGFLGVKEGLIFILTTGGHKVLGTGGIGDNNSVASVLLMIAPLTFYLYRYSEVKYVRLALMAILVLSIITVVATFSRGGFVGLLVLGLFAVKNSRNRASSFLVVTAVGLAIYGLAPESWFARLDTINDATSDTSFTSRLVAWKISLLIALDRPWFGGGFHAIQQGLVWETYRPFLHLVDFISTPPAGERAIAAHSVWFEILGDLGFVGLAVFLAILGMAFWNCRRVFKLADQDPDLQWAADLARMIQISLATYVVTSSALSQGYSEIFYIIVALASRMRRTVHETLAARAATQTVPTRPLIRNPAPWDAPMLRKDSEHC